VVRTNVNKINEIDFNIIFQKNTIIIDISVICGVNYEVDIHTEISHAFHITDLLHQRRFGRSP